MRCLITLLSLVLFYSDLLAQDRTKVDSLLSICVSSLPDTAKVFALKGLAWQYYYPNPDSAYIYAHKMAELSTEIRFVKGQWDAYNILGVHAYGQSKFDSAIIWFNKAVSLSNGNDYYSERLYSLRWAGATYGLASDFSKSDSCYKLLLLYTERNNDNIEMGKAYKSIGLNNYTQGRYLLALENYLTADSLFKDYMHYERAEVLHNIGLVYHVMENFTAEKSYYDQALALYEALGDKYGINAMHSSLGATELEFKNYEKAEKHFLQALSYFERNNDPLRLGTIRQMLGKTYLGLKEFEKSKLFLNAAISTLEGIEGAPSLSNAHRTLGDVFMETNQISLALEQYNLASEYSSRTGSLETRELVLTGQAEAYNKLGKYKEAYNVQLERNKVSDSLNSIKSSKIIHEIEHKYQNEKKQKEIELLTTSNELSEKEKQNQLFLLVGLVSIVLVIAIVFYFLYRNRQKTASKLKELDTIKSNFFANISHEFRTPLTLIKGPVQEQLSANGVSGKDKTNLEMIDHNADRLLSLVDQLLDLSKLEAGSMGLAVEKVDLTSFINVLTPSFQYWSGQKNVKLNVFLPSETTLCWIDKDVIEKVVTNLLSNAIKYTPEGGEIVFSMNYVKDHVVIQVKNNGDTLKIANIEVVFERFYQVDTTDSGVGIGLALVKELTTLHKGSIQARTTEDWIEFEVKFPTTKNTFTSREFKPASATTRPTSIPFVEMNTNGILDEVMPPEVDGPILLIVEDNADLRNLVKGLFEGNYSVIEAENGADGIEKALEHVPDIIISDVMMPVKDGVELSKTLKNDERTSHIPIILLTAKAGEVNEFAGLETGADDYITKPFSNDLLKLRVQKLIELRATLRQRYSQEVVLRPKDVAISSADEKFLERLQRIMGEKLEDSSFNAELFSCEMGMSRMQLHRKLKALIGLTTTEFIRSQRLKMAAHLLQTDGVNMSEVGYAVGFNDPSYFAKCFKEAYGCTPSDYSRENKL